MEDVERVIEEFLEGKPRASTLRELRQALETKLRRLEEDPSTPPEQIQELREQVRVLHEEELITQFVEDSIRFTLSADALQQQIGED
jgi:(p)ppGpp synthase/HD superfamily hydrolase